MSNHVGKLIAERVMGWRIHSRNTAHYVLAAQEQTTYEHAQAMHDWDPAASMDEAWRVVDAMRANHRGEFYKFAMFHRAAGKRRGWEVRFNKMRWGKKMKRPRVVRRRCAVHELPAMAICLAALRAVGVSESEIAGVEAGEVQ